MGDQIAQGIHEDLSFVGDNLEVIQRAIESRNERKDTWGWKSTSNLEVLPQIFPLLRNPYVICVTRDVVPVVERNVLDGLEVRGLLREQLSHYQWLVHSALSLPCPVLIVSYEKAKLLSEGVIRHIAQFIGVEPSPETINAAKQFVSKTYKDVWIKQVSTLSQVAHPSGEKINVDIGNPIRFLPLANVTWRENKFFSMGAGKFQLVFPDHLSFPGTFSLSFDLTSSGSLSAADLIFDFGEGLIAEPKISLPVLKDGTNQAEFTLNECPQFVQFEYRHSGGHFLIDNFRIQELA